VHKFNVIRIANHLHKNAIQFHSMSESRRIHQGFSHLLSEGKLNEEENFHPQVMKKNVM
jgi:hypothetical protein